MKLRAPAVPLFVSDPYFSIWSMGDTLMSEQTRHWTGKTQPVVGIITIDGSKYCFLGTRPYIPMLKQRSCKVTAMITEVRYGLFESELVVRYISPLLPENPEQTSRPVCFAAVSVENAGAHKISVSFLADDAICLNEKGQEDTVAEQATAGKLHYVRVGNRVQKPLNRCGDDLRIDWGYFYLGSTHEQAVTEILPQKAESGKDACEIALTAPIASDGTETRFLLAYDDVQSLRYFGKPVKACWTKRYASVLEAMTDADATFDATVQKCEKFAENLQTRATEVGGEKYAELLQLAYRQVFAAHKLAYDENGELLFISKECFSNGCAATVDVSYPSIPLFLLTNPALVNAMMRPIVRFARSEMWPYDFAPHDCGTYPLLGHQSYGDSIARKSNFAECEIPRKESQMPIEECGNMLVMLAAAAETAGSVQFASENWDLATLWANVLLRDGADPENQLCTDDFAGHLAHNCNLTLKAIMGLESYSRLCRMRGETEKAAEWHTHAQEMAKSWVRRAANGDGTYRLAFDRPDTFSLKYNLIWDSVYGSGLFDRADFEAEFRSYLSRANRYGMVLDNRADYTKSDWLVWSASWFSEKADFEAMVEPLWKMYHETEDRVPMTDWYSTATAKNCGFQNRTVQGGLFMRLLMNGGWKKPLTAE